jgi:hypothetical protein
MFHRFTTPQQGNLMLGLALALYAFFRFLAGAEFPTPVMDEAYFAPPSLAFAQSFDFHAPSLDPQRPLHWMPVGYPLLAGLWVRISGMQGLEGVRMFTTLGFVVLLVSLSRMARRLSPAQAWVMFAACLTVPLMGMSSMSRMEPVFWCFVVWTLWSLLAARPALAMAFALMSGLIHPNGVFLCLAALAGAFSLAGSMGRASWWRATRVDLPVLLVAMALCLAYLTYEWRHWADFSADMQFQLQRKSRAISWRSPLNAGSAVVLVASVGMALWHGSVVRQALVVVGAALMLIRVVGQEIFYSPGYVLGLSMVLAAWLPEPGVQARTSGRLAPFWSLPVGAWTMPVWGGLLCVTFAGSVFIQGWHGSKFSWRTEAASALAAPDAQMAERIVADALPHLSAHGAREVSCLPWYECMSLWRAAERVGLTVKLYNPVTQPPAADLCVSIDRSNPGPMDERGSNWSRGQIVAYQIESCGVRWASGF